MDSFKELTRYQLEVIRVLYAGCLGKYRFSILGDLWHDIHEAPIPIDGFVRTRLHLINIGLIEYRDDHPDGMITYGPTYKGIWINYLINKKIIYVV
jgi:hypothetical protein